MEGICNDIANTSFVKSPASTAADLYSQYSHHVAGLLDRHASLISGKKTKENPTGWLSDSYYTNKSIRHQFEHIKIGPSSAELDNLHRSPGARQS